MRGRNKENKCKSDQCVFCMFKAEELWLFTDTKEPHLLISAGCMYEILMLSCRIWEVSIFFDHVTVIKHFQHNLQLKFAAWEGSIVGGICSASHSGVSDFTDRVSAAICLQTNDFLLHLSHSLQRWPPHQDGDRQPGGACVKIAA